MTYTLLFILVAFAIIKGIFKYATERPEFPDNTVPYTITGDGVGHKKAIDIIKSKKVKAQLKNMKVK